MIVGRHFHTKRRSWQSILLRPREGFCFADLVQESQFLRQEDVPCPHSFILALANKQQCARTSDMRSAVASLEPVLGSKAHVGRSRRFWAKIKVSPLHNFSDAVSHENGLLRSEQSLSAM